ncbi:MAG: hypothetical protein A3A86_02480 [Elusimicrobia bacterium RIFCSPLOWO2_01_FULL_60_11]|nr:MAG: hypothetical protein A3A86_02480 [Elusimicrobia bacterium RIFCSPLOWO2_01_FULL_60_11]
MKKIALGVFAASFAVYLFSSAPALAPYRDMGEMVSVSHTLGIAHPPGYPLYALAGKLATKIPLANRSYRLNLLSVSGGACACALFFLIMAELGLSVPLALLACLLWLSSTSFWVISIVTEMYSLNLAAGLLFLYLWLLWERKNEGPLLILMAFLGGLFLGIRPDILLLAPAVVLLLKKDAIRRYGFWAVLFSALGFTVFLFLLIRSNRHPLLNWARPDTFERLLSALMRKSHGGTLDLLSVNYAPGELFWTDMRIYFSQVLNESYWFGVPLAGLGLWGFWKDKRRVFAFTAVAWVFSGPFFIYKANLPPNPHALAVLEAHFNLSKAFVYVWMGYGIFVAMPKRLALACLYFLALFALTASWDQASKRRNLFGYDYAKNIMKTLPRGSVLVMKKDVQLFLFWALQYAEGRRRDISVVAQGLSASPWYIENKKEEGFPVRLGPLKSGEDFSIFLMENPGKPVFAGWDFDVPAHTGHVQVPCGLVRKLALAPTAEKMAGFPDFLGDFYVRRGDYNYSDQKEFFSSDLIDDYSKAHYARAVELGQDPSAQNRSRIEWNSAIALHPGNAGAYYRRGFVSFQAGDLKSALRDFNTADGYYEELVQDTRDYHSLPDVVTGIKGEWTQVLLSMGVIHEKSGDVEASERMYLKALGIVPELAQAHYNLAVLYWNKDWDKVVAHLSEAVRIDPHHPLAGKFLDKALYARKKIHGL